MHPLKFLKFQGLKVLDRTAHASNVGSLKVCLCEIAIEERGALELGVLEVAVAAQALRVKASGMIQGGRTHRGRLC